MIIRISAELEDSHVLELSTRITNQQELMNLGINGLNLPRHTVQSAVYNNRNSIQDAAYAVISGWALQHKTKSKAYVNIIPCLQKCKMTQLATELRKWVEGATFTEQISKESKFHFFKYHTICFMTYIQMQPNAFAVNGLQE